MREVTPYMVSVATKCGISVIYHSLRWYIIYHSKLWYITDITWFVATLTIYGVTSHIPRNPYLNGKQVFNNKRLNQPTIIHLSSLH